MQSRHTRAQWRRPGDGSPKLDFSQRPLCETTRINRRVRPDRCGGRVRPLSWDPDRAGAL